MTKLSVDPPVVSSLLQILHLLMPHFPLVHFRLYNKLKSYVLLSTLPVNINNLTISRRRQGDYEPIFTEPSLHVIIEPEASNCFSINLKVFTNNNQRHFTRTHALQVYYCRKKNKSFSQCRLTDQNAGNQ